jgi:hypothetical protein
MKEKKSSVYGTRGGYDPVGRDESIVEKRYSEKEAAPS